MPSTKGHGPKWGILWAILYARVSTDEQARSGYSLAQQLEALREYAAREGYEVLEEVQDPGQSGASLERPGMDRMRDLVAAGSVYVVLAQDRDRIAREAKVMAGHRVKYGFKLNAARDGLLVDEDKMHNVRRIFRMVGTEGHSLNAVFRAFERERIPTPGGGKRWDRAFFRIAILDDV